MRRRNKIVLLFFLLTLFLIVGHLKAEVLCDPKDTFTLNQTFDQYFPVFLEVMPLEMKVMTHMAQYANETRAGIASSEKEAKRYQSEIHYAQKLKDIFYRFNVTQKDFTRFSVCIYRQIDQAKEYLKSHPDFLANLKKVDPDHMLLPKSIKNEEVSMAIIEKFVPIIIEEHELRMENRKRMKEEEEQSRDGMQQGMTITQLLEESMNKKEKLLQRYGITERELQKWRRPILQSPLTQEYLNNRRDLKLRFDPILVAERCAKEPTLVECQTKHSPTIPKKVTQEDVTLEIMERLFPVIVESGLDVVEEEKQLKRIEERAKNDPQEVARLKKQLVQESYKRQKERLKRYNVTHDELQMWRIPVLLSPLKEKYFDLYPEMQKKYGQITRPVKPVPLENQDGK